MITNFQIKPRKCKYHNMNQEFICLNKECQYRALLCSDCTRENHNNHLHDIRSIESFVQSFKQKVKFYEAQFDKDKVIINVKEIIKSKLCELDQVMNEILIQVVKLLEKEKQTVKQRLLLIEEKYQQTQNQYKRNLEARYDCLEYLKAYKDSFKALEARLLCSSQWGIVSIKNSLADIKNLSINQGRDVGVMTDRIIQETDKVLKQDNFIYDLKNVIHQFRSKAPNQRRNSRITSFIQKSFISANTNLTLINSPKSSRVIEQARKRTFSLSNANISRPISNQNISAMRKQPSLEKIPTKNASQNDLQKNKYLRGLQKLKLEKIIIKN